mmetsp:Transcript_145316/g.465596  ORF Transcript_145316/g.465596 Transcript_145316/m.465596 type:complete len:446 (-) Transcript_145316:118-1455(-)
MKASAPDSWAVQKKKVRSMVQRPKQHQALLGGRNFSGSSCRPKSMRTTSLSGSAFGRLPSALPRTSLDQRSSGGEAASEGRPAIATKRSCHRPLRAQSLLTTAPSHAMHFGGEAPAAAGAAEEAPAANRGDDADTAVGEVAPASTQSRSASRSSSLFCLLFASLGKAPSAPAPPAAGAAAGAWQQRSGAGAFVGVAGPTSVLAPRLAGNAEEEGERGSVAMKGIKNCDNLYFKKYEYMYNHMQKKQIRGRAYNIHWKLKCKKELRRVKRSIKMMQSGIEERTPKTLEEFMGKLKNKMDEASLVIDEAHIQGVYRDDVAIAQKLLLCQMVLKPAKAMGFIRKKNRVYTMPHDEVKAKLGWDFPVCYTLREPRPWKLPGWKSPWVLRREYETWRSLWSKFRVNYFKKKPKMLPIMIHSEFKSGEVQEYIKKWNDFQAKVLEVPAATE